MVPVHVAEHLVLREKQRLEGTERLGADPDLPFARFGVLQEDEPLEEPLDVDLAVGDAAEACVAPQVLHLVEIEASAHESAQSVLAPSPHDAADPFRGALSQRGQRRPHLPRLEEPGADLLVVGGDLRLLELLQRVGEGVVADVVQKRGVPNQVHALPDARRNRRPGLEDADCAVREVVDPERVVESGVRGAGVDEVRQPQLPDVAKPLEGRGVDDGCGYGIQADRVPHRITDDERPSMADHGGRH